ncbi:hypothetical protein EME01_44850 [Sinorhizobium meliloti]|nr:hypothetical protein EME01_44850 [Sinorhizobium meliloti]
MRDGEVLRRAGDRALLGDGDEILQLPECECHVRINTVRRRERKHGVNGSRADAFRRARQRDAVKVR